MYYKIKRRLLVLFDHTIYNRDLITLFTIVNGKRDNLLS